MDQIELARIRTVLAAERTFSAWVRTGLATLGGGLAIVKLVPFKQVEHEWIARLTGQLLIIAGCGIFLFALVNYGRTRRALGTGDSTSPPVWVFTLLSLLLAVIGLFVLWLTI